MVAPVVAAGSLVACGNPDARRDEAGTPRGQRDSTSVASPALVTRTATPEATGTAPPSETASAAARGGHPAPIGTAVPSATPPATFTPVVLTFDTYPEPPWYHPTNQLPVSIADGILTIDAPADTQDTAVEFISEEGSGSYRATDPWTLYASNQRGWVVEARLRVDPLTPAACGDATEGPILSPLTIWITDDKNFVQLGLASAEICLIVAWNEKLVETMDTTSGFHVYRLEGQGTHVAVCVDGTQVMAYDDPQLGRNIKGFVFGDGVSDPGRGGTRSYWDYFAYDVGGAPERACAGPVLGPS